MNLADLLTGVLERGFVLVVKLDGPPGDRRLLVGLGLPESAESLLLALTATSALHRPPAEGWWDE